MTRSETLLQPLCYRLTAKLWPYTDVSSFPSIIPRLQVYLRRWDRWRWAAPSRCRPSPKAAADRQRQTPGLWAGQSRRYASGSCLESGHLRRSSCPALVCSECISSASKQGKNMMRHKPEISRQKFTLKFFHGSCSESQSSVTNRE